jgi:flagellar assembly factor FliW
MGEIVLKGKIIGFEEITEYVMDSPFGLDSPMRVLFASSSPITFVLVNPYEIYENYTFEIDEELLKEELGESYGIDDLAVMCIVRVEKDRFYANLRSPLLINTKNGRFTQVILQEEGYPTSFPFGFRKE